MVVIVCLDNNNAMSFNSRRQSMDRVVRERIVSIAGKRKLRMSPYSAAQFGNDIPICADVAFADKAVRGEACFVEDAAHLPKLKDIEKIVIFRWNTVYPADTYFPQNDFEKRWKLIAKEEFSGYSHKTITQEVYAL